VSVDDKGRSSVSHEAVGPSDQQETVQSSVAKFDTKSSVHVGDMFLPLESLSDVSSEAPPFR
jgi:hypothetical protein